MVSRKRVQRNTDKCKEIRTSFTRSQQQFEPILIDGDALEMVESVKLLGLNISSDLQRLNFFWFDLKES